MRPKILLVAGTRPNFIKISPLMREFAKCKNRFQVKLVHTGQHYDISMSDLFFRDLNISRPDVNLGVGSASHAGQTARIMIEFEKVLEKERPGLVIVVGDVNSTLACSLVASMRGVKVAHVEAGLRSFDRGMPEEINRILTDSISDLLFVSEKSGLKNLKKEGIPDKKVFFVGNVMIDTLMSNVDKINASTILKTLKVHPLEYGVATLHRPSNVDSRTSLFEMHEIFKDLCEKNVIVYPIHPRTRRMIEIHKMKKEFETIKNLFLIEPMGYVDFVRLVKESRFVVTDSGGLQEETTILGVPCLTVRENTERPITLKEGTNILVGRDRGKINTAVERIVSGRSAPGKIPELWDGKSASRIIRVIKQQSF